MFRDIPLHIKQKFSLHIQVSNKMMQNDQDPENDLKVAEILTGEYMLKNTGHP